MQSIQLYQMAKKNKEKASVASSPPLLAVLYHPLLHRIGPVVMLDGCGCWYLYMS